MAATLASPTLTLVRPAVVDRAAVVARPAVLGARPAVLGAPAGRAARSEPHGLLGLGGLRLTRRGRVVLVVLSLLVALPLAGLGGRAVAGEPGAALEVTVHTVAPGETLWGFARQIAAPGQDVRDVVEELRDLNELASGALRVGQTILIPRA
ncbi:LysM peptidoglycan-binding domain-containing protein [Xylanimonas protaetiae]|uniref:LysM peptidoglycan-binding domain-containing protein n=1 Tax=Xylanimonas protaetiae TaxID=2509457 RepID=A0A4P6F720_9MICO|nr:LysM peptidoglycan-binding domain-containing protein [Xylanimonas protaetiae]QAY70613.1 LysM peptidoglycan-binding domain-containing protein [Xylanimonas protaetiae]